MNRFFPFSVSFLSIFLIFLLFNPSVRAAQNAENREEIVTTQKEEKNIYKGNLKIGGSAGIVYHPSDTYAGNRLLFRLEPSVHYFVQNRLSLGATGSYQRNSQSSFYEIGPEVSYYFWDQGKWASYASQAILTGRYSYRDPNWKFSESLPLQGSTKLGIQYFFTREVAFGTLVSYDYALPTGDDLNLTGRLNMNWSFSVYF